MPSHRPSATALPRPARSPEPPRPARRRRWPWVLGVLAGAVGAAYNTAIMTALRRVDASRWPVEARAALIGLGVGDLAMDQRLGDHAHGATAVGAGGGGHLPHRRDVAAAGHQRPAAVGGDPGELGEQVPSLGR